MLIDEPSIGLSPHHGRRDCSRILDEMHERGITVLLIEQNAKRALESSDYGIVLELGRTRIAGYAPNRSWPIRVSASSSSAAGCR